MSPIYVRPVREQLEHDRLIRQLQTKYQKKFEVAINLGEERLAAVKLGANEFFPDLVLYEGKKLAGVIEVESAESTNNLEAMSQWVHFSRARVPFHLYVPVQAYDTAKRLADANSARISEIWTYRAAMDSFDLVRMHWDATAVARSGPKATAVPPKPPPVPLPPPVVAAPVKPAAPVPAPKVTAPAPAPKGAAPAPKAVMPAPRAAVAAAKSKPPAAKAKPTAKPVPVKAKAAKSARAAKKPSARPAAKAAKKPDRSRKAGSARKR